MKPKDWGLYLLGNRKAIETVATSRSAVPTGIALVLITAIARNYDQTHISEKPLLWIFGPLLFSLVSGTWMFLVLFGLFGGREPEAPPESPGVESASPATKAKRPGFWSQWPGFMGLFWMTAPIAWLYAIPVERFLDPVEAAKANWALLAIVSCWRIALISRVISVIGKAPFIKVLIGVSLGVKEQSSAQVNG